MAESRARRVVPRKIALALALAAAAAGALAGAVAGLALDNGHGQTTFAIARTLPAELGGGRRHALTAEELFEDDARAVVAITRVKAAKGPVDPLGAGFVIDDAGDVLTNDDLGHARNGIRVGFSGGTTYAARLVGADPSTDVAVVRVAAPKAALHPLEFANSEDVAAGRPRLRDREPARPRADDHGRHRERGRQRRPGAERTDDRAVDPDRRPDRPRELGRAAPRPLRARRRRQRPGRCRERRPSRCRATRRGRLRSSSSPPATRCTPGSACAPRRSPGGRRSTCTGCRRAASSSWPSPPRSPAAKARLEPATRKLTVNGVGVLLGGDSIVSVGGKHVATAEQLADALA